MDESQTSKLNVGLGGRRHFNVSKLNVSLLVSDLNRKPADLHFDQLDVEDDWAASRDVVHSNY